jgi:hypothetical protein
MWPGVLLKIWPPQEGKAQAMFLSECVAEVQLHSGNQPSRTSIPEVMWLEIDIPQTIEQITAASFHRFDLILLPKYHTNKDSTIKCGSGSIRPWCYPLL